MASSSDEEVDNLKWDMQDDLQFVLKPGYKFPNPMTYKAMCERVNFEVQKVGSDPVRPKIRKRVQIRGELVPSIVSFYCQHRRKHIKRDKAPKTPAAKRADRSQESRSFLYSKCTCCFNIVLDPSELVGYEEVLSDLERQDEDEAEEAAEQELQGHDSTVDKGEKEVDLSENTTASSYMWMVAHSSAPTTGAAPTGKKGRPKIMCFEHFGHPKRILRIGDITSAMQADIRTAGKTNMAMSSLQALLYEKHKIYVTLSQLRYEIATMTDLDVVRGNVTQRTRGVGTQAESLVEWILEQDDTNAVILIQDVDMSSRDKPVFETWTRVHTNDTFHKVDCEMGEFDGVDAIKGIKYDESRFFDLGSRRVFLVAIVWSHEFEVRIFSAYPELLVIDGKMNTNKNKQEHFCGVGIDGDWGNAVLFRAWLPNKTEHSCSWLWLLYIWLFALLSTACSASHYLMPFLVSCLMIVPLCSRF
jgi:hypothetical protein